MTIAVKPRWLDWLPLLGMVFTIAGLIWAGATYASKIDNDDRRITALELAGMKQGDTLGAIDARTARIEGTLDAMRDKRAPQ